MAKPWGPGKHEAKAHIDRIKAMQEIRDIQEEKRVSMDSVASRMGNKTIELAGISKSYDGRKVIEDYNYIFLKNDRIGIIGPNGCGKSTLLRIINGIVKAGRRKSGYRADDPYGIFLPGK